MLSASLSLEVAQAGGFNRTLVAERICRTPELGTPGAITAATHDGVSIALTGRQPVSLAYTAGSTATIPFDVTAILQAWANGEANLGFRLRQTGLVANDDLSLYSFNATTQADRPVLTIEYVAETGAPNPTPTPECSSATSTPTPASTPTETPTPSETMVASGQLLLRGPPSEMPVPRSRLAFIATVGSLTLESVGFMVQRADGMYWNGTTEAWETDAVENVGVDDGSGEWRYDVTGEARRQFAGTTVSVIIQAVEGTTTYVLEAPVEVTVR